MRLFIAVTFSSEFNSRLAAIQEELRRSQADVKWVERENFHLTLKFLGEVEPERALKLVDALKRGTRDQGEILLQFKGLGVFPGWSRPRVIWMGLVDNPLLRQLHQRLEQELLPLNFSVEDFTPHLTLGRLRSPYNWPALQRKLLAWQEEYWGEERVKQIVLMESRLTSRGPQYYAQETFSLT
ncbi:MAG: RNA 2',3'-cyclic phosphodiesterase [Moorellaceae bacterium]